ncbi:MAG: phosphoribosylaminoimidazolesuccinocarboxamide synthase [Planctomycetota bacterium]|nr:phosphoribosylaminoimidazolesuccinocarboxamide synthase [Planctomycetota bacterium]
MATGTSATDIYLGRTGGPPGYALVHSGKVRDIYTLDGEHLLFVATDRVSAFDVVMREGIPGKGRVLSALSAFWFEKTRDVVPNHLVSTRVEDVPGLDSGWRARLRGRVQIVRRATPTPVEWVVRGYVAGSGWKDYQRTRSICGVALPVGLQHASRLETPILTPTTKEAAHDLPLTHDEARAKVGAATFDEAQRVALALYRRGTEVLEPHGILLADTKFEFGILDGRLVLIDEVLTPDSSRFWPRETWKPGENPPSYDKQILRDWLETTGWNKEPPPPALDPAVLARVAQRYLEICQRITGRLPEGVEVAR